MPTPGVRRGEGALNILVDIVHPAHVHFFRHIIRGLEERGHHVSIVARDKDVTLELLDRYGLAYVSVGRAGRKSRFRQFVELLGRVLYLWREARRCSAEVILTRNPAGVLAARLAGAMGVFDTDDGSAAGIHFRTAAPFAHYITTPDCHGEDLGPRQRTYPGYKQSAYLHPDLFTPDAQVLDYLGLEPGARYFLLRFVSMTASHDAGEGGLPMATKRAIVEKLRPHGRVFISCEGDLPAQWEPFRLKLPAHLVHDILARCSLFIGDSQTMAAEAAFLGVPNLRVSTFVGRLPYLQELEQRYHLTRGYLPGESEPLLEALDAMLADPGLRDDWATARDRLLREKTNVADWYVDFVEAIAHGPGTRHH